MSCVLNSDMTRRRFMATTAATGAALATTPSASWACHEMVTRKSLQGANVMDDLERYKSAVGAMLALPPDDPRNWYRNAFTHLLDCPHGNWWFLVWHRGYLAWFERICREVAGEPEFALPFWDWTEETKIPDGFWDDVLDPNANAYAADLQTFRDNFRGPMEDYWNSFTPAQQQQQATRGFTNFNFFWSIAEQQFFPNGRTRTRTQADPDLSASATAAVAGNVIIDLLAPAEFVTSLGSPAFESVQAGNHHQSPSDYSILEGQPHNLVHGSIGGYMGRFLSPSDPIFFMHHCNIDRLWDVWTRKQQALGLPIGPQGTLETAYRAEEFLFYHNEQGNPASETTAGDYFDAAPFHYDYEPGTGEDVIPQLLASAEVPTGGTEDTAEAFGLGRAGSAAVMLPSALTELASEDDPSRRFFTKVTITPPPDTDDILFDVFVGPKGADLDLDPEGNNFAGSFAFFGSGHHHEPKPATFTVGITDAIARMREQNQLAVGQEIEVAVVASATEPGAAALDDPGEGSLNAVKIGAF